jgi:uncharacterized protein with von Willebrand factor type A (vWA) domain
LQNYIENNIARFVHILRHLGIQVSILETITSLQALALVDILNRDHVKMALSAAMIKNFEITDSTCTPSTESRGPVMPTSVI